MFNLVRSVPVKTLLIEQMPAFLAAFVIAEVFYKFHSFSLECLAFLATWSVFSSAIAFVLKKFKRPEIEPAPTR